MIETKMQAAQHENQAEPPARPNIQEFVKEIDNSDFREELRVFLFLFSEPNF